MIDETTGSGMWFTTRIELRSHFPGVDIRFAEWVSADQEAFQKLHMLVFDKGFLWLRRRARSEGVTDSDLRLGGFRFDERAHHLCRFALIARLFEAEYGKLAFNKTSGELGLELEHRNALLAKREELERELEKLEEELGA